MGLVAVERLRWGDGWIEPGAPVPEGEDGRDYGWLTRHGHIIDVAAAGGVPVPTAKVDGPHLVLTDEEKASLAEKGLTGEFTLAELDAALTEEATEEGDPEADSPAASDDALPEGVTETGGGWFQLPDGTKVRGRDAVDQALAK